MLKHFGLVLCCASPITNGVGLPCAWRSAACHALGIYMEFVYTTWAAVSPITNGMGLVFGGLRASPHLDRVRRALRIQNI